MPVRLLTTTAILLLSAGSALADCEQDLAQLEQAVVEAETGASGDAAMPATEHQQQVIGDGQDADDVATSVAPAAGSGESDMPASPHQQQVLAEGEQAQAEGKTMAEEPAGMIAEARDMAAAGDEQGCLQKVAEAKSLLGID